MIDPLRHPDLVEVEARLRERFRMVLEAEQAAAVVRHQRSLDLRDRLMEAEDGGDLVAVSTTDGQLFTGSIEAVGMDHVVVRRADTRAVIMLYHLVSLELPR